MEYWRLSSKKRSKSGNSYFAASLWFLSSPSWFLRACNKKEKVLAKLRDWPSWQTVPLGFCQQLEGIFVSNSWVILENWSALCKANFCKGGWVREPLSGLTPDRQCGTKHFLRASGYGERMCQAGKETELEVATARESLAAVYVQSCGCSNSLRRPAGLFNWLGASDHARVLVPSPILPLCRGLELTPPNPRNAGGTGPTDPSLPPPGEAGLSPARYLVNQGSVQPRMETAGPLGSLLPRCTSSPSEEVFPNVQTEPSEPQAVAAKPHCDLWFRNQIFSSITAEVTQHLVHVLFRRNNWKKQKASFFFF